MSLTTKETDANQDAPAASSDRVPSPISGQKSADFELNDDARRPPRVLKKKGKEPGASHVLSENHMMLKSINVNKMNHQYIQNLQKANMTLKCKIKEMSEMSLGEQVFTLTKEEDGHWFDLEGVEEQMEICELGTIEEISAKAIAAKKERLRRQAENQVRREKERKFYDKAEKAYKSGATKGHGIWNASKSHQTGGKE